MALLSITYQLDCVLATGIYCDAWWLESPSMTLISMNIYVDLLERFQWISELAALISQILV